MSDKLQSRRAPCKECPYLKTSAKGYLGEASGKPIEFLQQLDLPEVHPCHKSVNWEKENLDTCDGSHPICTGALQFMSNSCKIHKNPAIQRLQKEAGKSEDIISFPHNFIKHHTL